MPKKLRLDQLLVGRGLFPSREQARRAILAGEISVATRVADKPSELLDEQTAVAVKPKLFSAARFALIGQERPVHESKTALPAPGPPM